MKEIEVKILEVDSIMLRSILKRKKARLIKKVFQESFFYKNSFTNNNDITVRIRREAKKIQFTVKSNTKFVKGHKIRDEYEVLISDFVKLESILFTLGFKKIKTIEMKREYWRLLNCSIEFCRLPNIPAYIEIEGDSKNIDKVAKILGYNTNDYFLDNIQKYYGFNNKSLFFD